MPERSPFDIPPGPDNVWPPFPGAPAARLMAVLAELERSQWETPAQILENQFRQIRAVAGSALARIPFHRDRMQRAGIQSPADITPEAWRRLPLLSKDDLRREGQRLENPALGKGHGKGGTVRSSGSTGTPVSVRTTGTTRLLWSAFTARDYLWHGRNMRLRLGSIRYFRQLKEQGAIERSLRDWGTPLNLLFQTGPAEMLNIRSSVDAQLDWLARKQPNLLVTYPSNAKELARQSLARRLVFPFLQEVLVFGETVDDDVRNICREAWHVPVTDVYSANEVGYMALQCPGHDHYHVQSENVYLELLRDDMEPCKPGEAGRVVVTTLHNLAMPLVRYDVGDLAEAGEPCSCGRGLPVIRRILGRVRNMLVLPTGERYWPQISALALRKLAPIARTQFIQRTLDEIDVRLVVDRPLTAEEMEKLTAKLQQKLNYPFKLNFTIHEAPEQSPVGKIEEFKSLVAQ